MSMNKPKEVLTTGQVAKICNVAPRTVSKWFDSGQLRGYRIPGSKDRRIPLEQLIRFMRAHGIPLDGLETSQTRVLIVDAEAALVNLLEQALVSDQGYEVKTAGSGFQAGVLAGSFRPHVMLVDVSMPDIDARKLVQHIRSDAALQHTRLIAVSGAMTNGQAQGLRQEGFDVALPKPFDVRQVLQAIDQLQIVPS